MQCQRRYHCIAYESAAALQRNLAWTMLCELQQSVAWPAHYIRKTVSGIGFLIKSVAMDRSSQWTSLPCYEPVRIDPCKHTKPPSPARVLL